MEQVTLTQRAKFSAIAHTIAVLSRIIVITSRGKGNELRLQCYSHHEHPEVMSLTTYAWHFKNIIMD